jgi:putative RNA 2'-phosphotransferase
MENREKQLKGYSKFLSYVLRHNPGQIGLELDKNGWANVEELLHRCQVVGRAKGLNREIMDEVVATNNKKRFEYSEDGKKIRARQGHSVQVDLGDEPTEPPEILFHGTPTKSVEAIKSGGLLKMSRHAVHLSKDHATAYDVGRRRGKPVIIQVQARKMHGDGYKFYLTANGVWYTDHVPTDYLKWPGERGYASHV